MLLDVSKIDATRWTGTIPSQQRLVPNDDPVHYFLNHHDLIILRLRGKPPVTVDGSRRESLILSCAVCWAVRSAHLRHQFQRHHLSSAWSMSFYVVPLRCA